VRVVRQTTPEVVMTMNPAPSPGNHGGHQEAALLAVEAYYAAGDPTRFPGQIRREGLKPFSPSKLLTTAVRGTTGVAGPNCPTSYTPLNPADDIYGVWSGRQSRENGKTWAQVEREAQRAYASQGWSVFPDVSADPKALTCDFMTQIDARVPFTRGDLTADAASSSTMLEGAVLRSHDGLPLGTGLDLSTEAFEVVPGGASRIRMTLSAPKDAALPAVRAHVDAPPGWGGAGRVLRLGRVKRGQSVTRSFQVTAPTDAATDVRALIGLTVRSSKGSGFTDQQLAVVPTVQGTQQLLPQVGIFHRWAERNGVDSLKGIVKPVLTLASGGTRTVSVDVTNHGTTPESGKVTLELPAGFAADQDTRPYADLAPGETTQVQFLVTNTDESLKTSNEGGVNGDYDYTIVTTSSQGPSRSTPALELVPVASVADTPAPTLDGQVDAGEYSAEIDLSRLWEGTACTDAADCSGTGYVTRSGDSLYVAADVTDESLGTKLTLADCKRHWRTDSLEIAIDPTGRSENTSTTFKAAVLPTTVEGPACAARDADNRQGPIGEFPELDAATVASVNRAAQQQRCDGGGRCGCPYCNKSVSAAEQDGSGRTLEQAAAENTAPGFDAVSRLKEPYTGYVIETRIPMDVLPDTIDPQQMGFNMFIYDSDTQDKTGQTRLGWSTWGGVQGDPYRWGRVRLTGTAPPSVPRREPDLDFEALSSLESPQSIAQAVRTGVALSGLPEARPRQSATLRSATQTGARVRARVDVRGSGVAHLFVLSRSGAVIGQKTRGLEPGSRGVTIRVDDGRRAARVLLGYDPEGRGTTSSATRVRPN
jgi:hypothetical protein